MVQRDALAKLCYDNDIGTEEKIAAEVTRLTGIVVNQNTFKEWLAKAEILSEDINQDETIE